MAATTRSADRFRARAASMDAPRPRPRRQARHARRVGLRGAASRTTTRTTSSGPRCRTPPTRVPGASPTSATPAGRRPPRRGCGGRGARAARTSSSSAPSTMPSSCATLVSDTPEWSDGGPAPRFSAFAGRHHADQPVGAGRLALRARMARRPRGSRLERWRAEDGSLSNATTTSVRAASESTSLRRRRCPGRRARLAAARPRPAARCATRR